MRGYKNADEGLQKGFTDLEQEGNFIVPGRHAAVKRGFGFYDLIRRAAPFIALHDKQGVQGYKTVFGKKEGTTKDALIDWIEFYAVSAIFQPCNGGDD